MIHPLGRLTVTLRGSWELGVVQSHVFTWAIAQPIGFSIWVKNSPAKIAVKSMLSIGCRVAQRSGRAIDDAIALIPLGGVWRAVNGYNHMNESCLTSSLTA